MYHMIILIFLCGCCPYRMATSEVAACIEKSFRSERKAVHCHPIYAVVPRHRCQIYWFDLPHWVTWSLFGNDDDGVFGERANYRLGTPPTYSKAFCWWWRNSFHNFTFYVIGSAHRQNSQLIVLGLSSEGLRLFEYRPVGTHIHHGQGSSVLFAFHGGKPFLSMRLAHDHYKGDFYVGWRKRGNFGIKFSPFGRRRHCMGNR